MICLVLQTYHDYEQGLFFIDSTKLDPTNPIDAEILKNINNPVYNYKINIHCDNYDRSYGEEPDVSDSCVIGLTPPYTIDLIIDLSITF